MSIRRESVTSLAAAITLAASGCMPTPSGSQGIESAPTATHQAPDYNTLHRPEIARNLHVVNKVDLDSILVHDNVIPKDSHLILPKLPADYDLDEHTVAVFQVESAIPLGPFDPNKVVVMNFTQNIEGPLYGYEAQLNFITPRIDRESGEHIALRNPNGDLTEMIIFKNVDSDFGSPEITALVLRINTERVGYQLHTRTKADAIAAVTSMGYTIIENH